MQNIEATEPVLPSSHQEQALRVWAAPKGSAREEEQVQQKQEAAVGRPPVAWNKVPAPVRQAHERGWSVVPQSTAKRVIVKWSRYRNRRPTREQVIEWARRSPPRWAIVTGRRSIIVLDFDGPEGMATLKKLGLKPTLRTPHGGHVWVEDTPYKVHGGARVAQAEFPGLDIRADGQVATFYGEGYKLPSPPRSRSYKALPLPLRRLLRSRRRRRPSTTAVPLPEDFNTWTPWQVLLGDALARLTLHPRNETGFWLACQLRDERCPRAMIWQVMQAYADQVADMGDHSYSRQEAYDSMVSALSQPPRAPRALRDEERIEFLANVQATTVEWLWGGRIPVGKVTIIEGDPDRGKSTLTLDLAARITRGAPMPDSEQSVEPGAVLLVTAEDDLADTVVPRLSAAGANLERVAYIRLKKDEHGRVIPLSIPEDLGHIERSITELADRSGLPVKLLIVDPITAYLSEKIHYGNDPQVRKAMWPLKQLAEETGVAVLLVRHLNKDGSLRAMYRGGGSVAFGAAARSVFVVEKHPDQEGVYVFARVKMNIATAAPTLTFRITTDPEWNVSRLEWGGAVDLDADALLRGPDGRRDAPMRKEAERFLLEFLKDGPREFREIDEAAKAAGLTMKTVKYAKARLAVKARRVRNKAGKTDRWEWVLPAEVRDGKVVFNVD